DDEQRAELIKGGYSKSAVKRYLIERTARTNEDIQRLGDDADAAAFKDRPGDELIPLFRGEDAIHIVAGGVGNRFSAYMPTWRSEQGLHEPVSRKIRVA